MLQCKRTWLPTRWRFQLLALGLLAQAPLAPTTVHAAQTVNHSLSAAAVFNAAVFSFGNPTLVDGFTPPQTGSMSSAALQTNGGVQALLNANPQVQAQFSYDPALLAPGPGNAVLASYFGTGSDLAFTLPAGTTGTPLAFSKGTGVPGFLGIANNARLTDSVATFTAGATDALLFGLATNSFSNAGLTLSNPPGPVFKVDLLADPQFVATYNGAVALPTLPSLIVTLQATSSLTLNDPSLQLLDPSGQAFNSLALPASIGVNAFARTVLSIPFDGVMLWSLSAADYASAGDFAQAQAWAVASGLQSQVLFRQVATWDLAPVPEPATALLAIIGFGLLLARSHRMRAQAADAEQP